MKLFSIVSLLIISPLVSQYYYTPWKPFHLPESLEQKDITPKKIEVSPIGDLYILDDENYWLVWISDNRVRIAGGWGLEDKLFDQPGDICTANGLDVYLTDNSTHRVLRYDRKLNFIGELYLNNLSPISVEYPHLIESNSLGELMLTSNSTWQMNLLSYENKWITHLGDVTYGKNRFLEISDMDVNRKNDIGLIDMGKDLFVEMSRSGLILRQIPLPGSGKKWVEAWQNGWLCITDNGTLYNLPENSRSFVQLYATEEHNRKVKVEDFSINGFLLYIIDGINVEINTSYIQ